MSDRPTVVFASWSSRYSDNPRAIGEELHRRGDPVRQVWLLGDDGLAVPGHVHAIPADGPAAEAQLARAAGIVSNDVISHAFAKAPQAPYLQTWHGTPLKRIAHDVASPSFPEADNYVVWLPRDVARWDVLLSPNRFSTEVLRGAFRFEGEIVETGYPRNDVLLSPQREEIRSRVRERLGLADDVTAVLYAPTWRDPSPFTLELDLDALARELGDDHVILLRAHWLVAATVQDDATEPHLRHVTAYPDIAELYLAADVLLTDYSSAMFDFANTGKPMLFYVYDLEHYRDEVRGFYFDFEAEAPGPLLRSTDAVIAALGDLENVAATHAPAYERFRERFCHLEDGQAARRAADLLLARLGLV